MLPLAQGHGAFSRQDTPCTPSSNHLEREELGRTLGTPGACSATRSSAKRCRVQYMQRRRRNNQAPLWFASSFGGSERWQAISVPEQNLVPARDRA